MRAADVIARPKRNRTYLAARANLTLVRSPVRTIRNPSDGTVMDKTEPDRIHFRNGLYTAKDEAEAEWLEKHPRFDDPLDGFRLHVTPAPQPSVEELSAILAAGTDLEQLEEVLAVEREGYARPQILEMVSEQITRLKAAQAAEKPAQSQKQTAGAKG